MVKNRIFMALANCLIGLICLCLGSQSLAWESPAAPPSVTKGAQRYKLENGLTVILKEDHTSPVSAVQVWVKTGSANEREKEAGITHLIEHMIFKGTKKRKTGEIARAIESAGGQINAYTSYDRTVYHVEIRSSHLETALDVLLDAVQHSTFDPTELAREKEVVLEEYRRSLDSPTRRLAKAVMRLCFHKHPYGRPIIGYEDTIRSFDRNAILSYVDRWYTPKNVVLVVVGDFDSQEVLNKVRFLTRDFPKRRGQRPLRVQEPAQRQLRQRLLHQDVKQVYLDMSWHIPGLSHPDTPALDVLEILLSYGKSSRLYDRLKSKENLVHDIDASAYEMLDSGLFSIEATLQPGNLHRALKGIAKEVRAVQRRLVPEAELQKAKKIVEADFLYAMETASGQARTLGFFETMTGDMRHSDEYLRQVRAVSPEDILRVARTYLRPSNMSAVAIVPKDSPLSLEREEVESLFRANLAPPKGQLRHGKSGVPRSSIEKIVLMNGLRLLVKENHNLPVVSVVAVFLGGSRLEPNGKWGISGFVAEMLTRGTTNMSARDIALVVEGMGARLNAFSGRNSFGITGKFLSRDLARGFDILSEIIKNPTFLAGEVEKVRVDLLQTIKAKQDRPMAQLFDLFYATLYKHHPYGHPKTGTEQTVRELSREDLMDWYRSMADPSRLVIAVVGDVDTSQVEEMVASHFSDLPQRSLPAIHITPEPQLTQTRTACIHKDTAQVQLALGYLGVGLNDPLNTPMELVETALSGQGGRLFYRLRDKQSLAYAVTAFRRPGLDTGAFGVYLGCAPEKFPVAKEAILKEMEELRDNGLSPEELKAAKEYLLGMLAIERQTNGAQALTMALNELYGLGYNYEKRHIERVKRVTLEEIKEAVHRVLVPGSYVLVTVGPESTDDYGEEEGG